uniref:NADAR domain-containing protein n=1 Tax=Magallana gigas TaxID=29159 RepID=A0A8W8JKC0_MAGGI
MFAISQIDGADKKRPFTCPSRDTSSCGEDDEWRETVMEEVIMHKDDQVKDFRAKLELADPKSVFADATFDTFWGTGLDVTSTKGATSSRWSWYNKLGLKGGGC